MDANRSSSPPAPLALVITELEPGGAERCLVELATRLDRARFLPTVYALASRPAAGRDCLVRRLAEANVATNFLGFTSGWNYLTAVERLAALLREQQTQIVQTFLFHANVVGVRAARQAGVPHTFTGIRVADPRWWRIAVERWATAPAERHVCVSQSVAEFWRHHGFDGEKLVVIPNGIDMKKWQAAKPVSLQAFGIAAGRSALLYLGRLDKQKGLDRFFGEVPAILRELPQHDLLLVGDGPLRGWLERRAHQLGLGGRVHFAGWRDDVADLMAACDLLVLPSRWEGMPNVVLEAMASGKPIVATQAEGTVELLGLAALEQTAAVGDWEGFRSRLISLMKDERLAADVGQRNRARAEQFSLEAMVQRYQRLYESLLQG